MRFKEFIAEDATFDIEQFKKDCAFMIANMKPKSFMWHGTNTGPADFEIRTWRARTAPRNSAISLHNGVNQFFEERFGAPCRNWMFTSTWKGDAQIYNVGGTGCHVIFPIGQFEWLSGVDEDLRDMTGWASRLEYEIRGAVGDKTGKVLSDEELQTLATQHILKRMPNMKWEFNTNLNKVMSRHNEIMIKCGKFYMLHEKGAAFAAVKKYLGTL